MKCDHTCTECGKHEAGNWIDDVSAKLAAAKLCHTCEFWFEKIRVVANPRSVRVEGVHYWIGDVKPKGYRGFLGFDGARFDIEFVDGRRVETHNLWCQGAIPERFKASLPDNARFVREPRYGQGFRATDIEATP